MPPTRMLCFNATKMLCSSSTRVLCSSSHQCASLTRFLVCSMRDKKLCSHSDRSCANWARASMCSVAPSMAFIVSKSTGVNDCPAPVSADWCEEGAHCCVSRVLHSSHPYAQGSYKKGLLASCCLERRNGLGVCDDHQRVQQLGAVHVVTAKS